MIVFTFAAAAMFLKKTSWQRASVVAALAVLSVQTLFHDAVFVGAICLGSAAVCAQRKNWLAAIQILTAGLLAAISLLPYASNLIAGQKTSVVLRTGMAWPRFFADLTTALGFPWKQYIYIWGLLVLVVAACAALALIRKTPATDKSADELTTDEINFFAGTTLLLAIAGYLGFLWMTAMPGQPWYFLPIMVLAATCFDAACSTFKSRMSTVLLGSALITVVISIPVARRDLDYRFTNIDAWSSALMIEAPREDFILVVPWFCGITFDHYFHGATPWTTIPPLADQFGGSGIAGL